MKSLECKNYVRLLAEICAGFPLVYFYLMISELFGMLHNISQF